MADREREIAGEAVAAWTPKSKQIAIRHLSERDASKAWALGQEWSDRLAEHIAAALRRYGDELLEEAEQRIEGAKAGYRAEGLDTREIHGVTAMARAQDEIAALRREIEAGDA